MMTSGLSALPLHNRCCSSRTRRAGVVWDQPLMERQRPSHPHLLLCNCREGAAPRWHHPTPFGIILCHICTGWHLKNHQLLTEIVKCCSGEDLLFCSLPYTSHWQRKNNTCSRFVEWLVFRSIFDHKIKSNHRFEKRSPQTTIRLLYRSQMKLHSNNSLFKSASIFTLEE